jgi:xylulokinase
MILLGIDIGSSAIKVSLFDGARGKSIASARYPSREMEIQSARPGWAEQDPGVWTKNLERAMELLSKKAGKECAETAAIGISYQMHGLVAVDQKGNPLRNAIIWCDSRAVEIGDQAFEELGGEYCLGHLLNSPGNFTASKLKWVKEHEPGIYKEIHKIMLPGDYIAYALTGDIRTTASGLSEGIFWDFDRNGVADELLNYYGLRADLLPDLVDTFAIQGHLKPDVARRLALPAGIPVTYRAGDQPNNAFSLNVLHPGEVAATAGTSGVVYGVTDQKKQDPQSRVNTFLHVNNSDEMRRLGVLLCLNATGILNAWARHQLLGGQLSYEEMNALAASAPAGAEGLLVMPFGNGAERMLGNRWTGASLHGLDLNLHGKEHLLRALQEGIVFALTYGLEIMAGVGLDLRVIKAGKANLFLSEPFSQTFADISGAGIELYNTDGAEGAARGAGVGAGYFREMKEAFTGLEVVETVESMPNPEAKDTYQRWKKLLHNMLEENTSTKIK